MGYRGHIRITNKIEYGSSICSNIEDFENAIEKLETVSGIAFIFWNSESNDDIELDTKDFLEAYKKVNEIKEKDLKNILKNIYEQAINSEDCKTNNIIRIDWF